MQIMPLWDSPKCDGLTCSDSHRLKCLCLKTTVSYPHDHGNGVVWLFSSFMFMSLVPNACILSDRAGALSFPCNWILCSYSSQSKIPFTVTLFKPLLKAKRDYYMMRNQILEDVHLFCLRTELLGSHHLHCKQNLFQGSYGMTISLYLTF